MRGESPGKRESARSSLIRIVATVNSRRLTENNIIGDRGDRKPTEINGRYDRVLLGRESVFQGTFHSKRCILVGIQYFCDCFAYASFVK